VSGLTPEEIDRILGFLGYGNPAAPLWFIGLEEGISGMGDSDVRHNLKARAQWSPVMDLFQSHLTLVQGGAPYDITRRPGFTPVWTWIAKFARAYGSASNWDDLSAAKTWVRENLGRFGGDVFMTYAMPIPESGLHTREWTDFLHRNGGNPDQTLARRRSALRALIEQHRPKVVICHGTTQTSAYQSLLPAAKWDALTAVPRISAATATYGGRFFVTPFFGKGQMSKEIANAFVGTLRQSGPLPEMSEGSMASHAREARTPRPSARSVPEKPLVLKSLRDEEYGDGIDPKGTVQLLDDLCKLGFDDEAFWPLHHKKEGGVRETISGFRKYCLDIRRFQKGGTNYFVHWRLFSLLRARLSGSTGAFETLAEDAYQQIPLRNTCQDP
jgi:hypothetical protein